MIIRCNQPTFEKLANDGHIVIRDGRPTLATVLIRMDRCIEDNVIKVSDVTLSMSLRSKRIDEFLAMVRLINTIGDSNENSMR